MWFFLFYYFFLIVFSALSINDEPIVAWIIPHTHDDVGWLETVDEYYMSRVQWILDTTVRALSENPNRKFTYVEIAFFKRWWDEQNNNTKKQFRGLVQNGQFKFNLGGWCMADEATPHYIGEINQLTEGHKFLEREFGDIALPKVGWHIDPFGHSSVYPSILANSGMHAFGLNRINYRLKDKLINNRTLEFIWRGSSSLGKETQIFTHVMDSHYSTPGECNYDHGKVLQWDNRMVTYKTDIADQATKFAKMVKIRNSWYQHSHTLIPYGDDFTHQNAHRSFANMDKLIDYVNNHTASLGVIAKYGHFDDYVDAVLATKTQWEVFEGIDFFPYIDSSHSWWTGYYTSRPELKGYVRSRDNVLRTGEILHTILPQSGKEETTLQILRRASGVSQHHDAVSGTEKQHVADDYTNFLKMGTDAVNEMIEEKLSKFMNNGSSIGKPSLSILSHSSIAGLNESNAISVVVFNSLSWTRSSFVSVDCSRDDLAVYDSNDHLVPSQINSFSFSNDGNPNLNQRLFFLASVPAIGFNTYFIRVNKTVAVKGQVKPFSEIKTISNSVYRVDFSETNGMMTKVSNLQSGKSGRVEETLVQYRPSDGRDGLKASGAYAFRPLQDSRFGVGSLDENSGDFKRVTYAFVESYSSTPKLFITAHGENNDDTFAMSVRNADHATLNVNIHRALDEDKGWAQNLKGNYLALTDVPPGFQTGSAQISPEKSSAFVTVKVTFPSAFPSGSTPRLIACVRGTGDWDDTFLVTPFGIQNAGVSLNITRLDGNGWGQSLVVDWLAWSEHAKDMVHKRKKEGALSQFVQGSQHLGKSPTRFKKFTIQMSGNLVGDPIIIVQIRGASGVSNCNTYISTIAGDAQLNYFKLNVDSVRSSGGWNDDLYVDWIAFPPKHFEAPVIKGLPKSGFVITGPFIQEVQQLYRDNYGKTTRLYSEPSGKSDLNFIEMVYSVGPLDKGAELVTRFQTDFKTDDHFYTDSNGLEMQTRIRDPTRDEPIAGNYYPSASCSFLRDSSDPIQMTLLHDRTHGVGSTLSGEIEVMLHRRCVKDDGFGVGEVLNENNHIEPSFYMLFDEAINSSFAHHRLALHQHFPLTPLFDLTNSPTTWTSNYITHATALKQELPPNLHILSLKMYEKQLYLRLQHLFEINEHPIWSQPITIDVNTLFDPAFLQVSTFTETLLTATTAKYNAKYNSSVVTLNARQIKTFAIQ